MSIRYRPDIEGLRAFAVLPVVFFHARLGPFVGGFTGVDVFFVISGYLITSIILKDIGESKYSIARFYERRVRRIFPALLFVLTATSIISAILMTTTQFYDYARTLIYTIFFSSNIFFWMNLNYFSPDAEENPLLHTWSLAVEEQFYIFFPIVLVLAMRFLSKRKLLTLFVVGIILSLAVSQYAAFNSPKAAFYLLPPRAYELLIGGLLALPGFPRASERIAGVASVSGLVLLLASMILIDQSLPFPGVVALVPCLAAAALIWSGAVEGTFARRLLSWHPVVFIGKISYSLYLWHWPILVMASFVALRELTVGERIACVLATGLMAWISTQFVERRFRGELARSWSSGKIVAAGMAACIPLLLAAFSAIALHGIPARLPDDARRAEAIAEQTNPHRDRCLAEDGNDAVPPAVSCLLGSPTKTGGYTAVLWGDSHADAIAPGLGMYAHQQGFGIRQISKAGCPPLIDTGFGDKSPSSVGAECGKFNDGAFRQIIDAPSVDTVFLVARWAQWSETTEANRIKFGGEHFLLDETSSAHSRDGSRGVLERSLTKTSARLVAAGKRVILIGQVPDYRSSTASCIIRAHMRDRVSGSCLEDKPFLLRRLDFSEHLLATIAQSNAKIAFWSPARILCPTSACAITAEGMPLYHDDDHLNRSGAQMLVARLASSHPIAAKVH